MVRAVGFIFACFLLAGFATGAERELPVVKLAGARREPVAALFWTDDTALVACAKSGTLIEWDLPARRIRQEFAVGAQLRGVVRLGDDELSVIDDKTHELIQLRYRDGKLTELHRYSVPVFPVGICEFQEAGEQYVAVASLWARQVTVWTRHKTQRGENQEQKYTLLRTIDMPFEPRLIVPVNHLQPGDAEVQFHVMVMDAFGGQSAAIDIRRGLWQEASAHCHNIGGLTSAAERRSVFFTHQILNQKSPITAEGLIQGQILSNGFTEWNAAGWQTGERQRTGAEAATMQRTVIASLPAGDPAGIAVIGSQLLVCLAGMDQVWLTSPAGERGMRFGAGVRPRFITTRGQRAICLGELDDSLTLLEIKGADATSVTTLLDPQTAQRELSPAERGERLFFSAKNSAGQQVSCHSCHTDGHTNGLLADTLGDNTHGTPKRVLTLRGTRLTDLWAWNGEMKTLQDNVHKSLRDTMHVSRIDPADVDDLVSFLHTLPPVPPLKPVPKDAADRELVEFGKRIFHRNGCIECHVPPLTYTSHASYDVGLADEKGMKKFNPPSLRGVGRLRNLLHDNRANSLRDVFETHGHQLKEPLPEEELRALVRFLESL
jgi:mono/diheme cytochrome c family protein